MQTLTQNLTFKATLSKNTYHVFCLARYLGAVRRSGKQWGARARRHGNTKFDRMWTGPYTTRNQAGETLRETERIWTKT